jgi:hypothetical protein
MRITGRNGVCRKLAALAAITASVFLAQADQKTPYTEIANLAAALGENNPEGALSYFDSRMDTYDDIAQRIEALTAQDDISCGIEVVTDAEKDGVHKLDLDWFMQLTTQSDAPQIERRRQRVEVVMRQIKGKWKITSLTPIGIFDPIVIH